MKDVAIVGGGLAGLVNAILLARAGLKVVLFERKEYPFHRVCGEYISNEIIPFLEHHDLYPAQFQPARITRFQLTSVRGHEAQMDLDLGGFGISRYSLDQYYCQAALVSGAEIRTPFQVESLQFDEDHFRLTLNSGEEVKARLVIGAFGKRSRLDKQLHRRFMEKRSPYMGIKYHIRYDHPADMVSLHNFEGGYCGINRVEDGIYNLCYLIERSKLKPYQTIPEMERNLLSVNPHLRRIFQEADFLFEKPEVINEISFATKAPVERHILMSGDAAGMITPLCGNGMAMAIHSAKILSALIIQYFEESSSRRVLEQTYRREWNKLFADRLRRGRQIQKLFGSSWVSTAAVSLMRYSKTISYHLMRSTHGEPVTG